MKLLFTSLFCSIAAWLITRLVLKHAADLRLISAVNSRSSHKIPTPHGGGLGFVAAASVAGGWLAFSSAQELALITALALAALVAIIGLADDIRHLSVRVRLAVQVLVCGGLLILTAEPPFFTANPLEGPELDTGHLIRFGLWLFAGVWWINLFNFMDGIDGLAGVQGVFMLIAGAVLAFLTDPGVATDSLWILMFGISAAVLGFLVLNWPPARIFMGDAGSTWLAFAIFATALISVQREWLPSGVWLILGAAFVSDATVTLLRRMVRGEAWYRAHRSHAYQRLALQWGGHRPVALLFLAINVVWLAPLALMCVKHPQWQWFWVATAYLPLIAGSAVLGMRQPPEST